jgi:hypothetical protein
MIALPQQRLVAGWVLSDPATFDVYFQNFHDNGVTPPRVENVPVVTGLSIKQAIELRDQLTKVLRMAGAEEPHELD